MKLNYLPKTLEVLKSDSHITKQVKMDYNTLSDLIFLKKYAITKELYFKRVLKYGDPYMKALLARVGKLLLKLKK